MAEQRIAAQDIIFREGEPAEHAYVVLSGSVETFTTGEHGEAQIAQYGAGELFGDTAIFDAHAPYPHNARASEDATVDSLTFAELTEMVKQSPPRLIPIISSVFERLAMLTQRPQEKTQVQAASDVDAEHVLVKGANEETAALFKPVQLGVTYLPLRIGGYEKDGSPSRNHGNHVLIPCDGPPLVVSSNHCEVILEDGEFYLRDSGSRFGTMVNGHAIGRGKGVYKSPLQKGDNTVILGDKNSSPYRITVTIA